VVAVEFTCTVMVIPPVAPGPRLAMTAVNVEPLTAPVGVAETKV
jgi:hypothetical protein